MSASLREMQSAAKMALDLAVLGIDALISAKLRCSTAEAAQRAGEAIGPLLRAAVMAMDLAGVRDGEDQRAALRKAIADYVDVPAPINGAATHG